jgi:hypothetical protein
MQNTQRQNGNELRTAISARNDARERLKKAAAALDRSQRLADDAQALVASHEQAAERASNQHAQTVERFIINGDNGSPPIFVPDERAAKALTVVKTQLSIAQQALRTLQQQHAKAQTELAGAEKCVRDVVTNLMIDEAVTLSKQILESEAATAELRIKLMGITEQRVFNERTLLGGPIGTQLPGAVVSSLLPTRAMPNSIAIVARYRDELWGSERFRVTQSIEKTTARIDTLIDGTDVESNDDKDPRAA